VTGYRVRFVEDGETKTSGPFDRARGQRLVHPAQSFYDGQELEDGFGYIETRDGTLLSATVILPGPAEEGPYPTIVEYSGYDLSEPPANPLR
jgi:predicted acyl esterase